MTNITQNSDDLSLFDGSLGHHPHEMSSTSSSFVKKEPFSLPIANEKKFHSEDYDDYKDRKDNYEAYLYFQLEDALKAREELKFPYLFFSGHASDFYVIKKPVNSEKNRHLWIWGAPSWGKSLWSQNTFEGKKVFFASGDAESRWETYRGEEICIFDGIIPRWSEINAATQPIKFVGTKVPGNPRNGNVFFEIDSVRTLIVIDNHHLHHYFDRKSFPGIQKRFRVVQVNPSRTYARGETD